MRPLSEWIRDAAAGLAAVKDARRLHTRGRVAGPDGLDLTACLGRLYRFGVFPHIR
jgi:hypothetical protein